MIFRAPGLSQVFAALAVGVSASSAFGGAAISYHGRILDSSDRPVENVNVVFKIQVRSPGTGNCLLYEETRAVNMAGSNGVFVIPIGDGQGARSGSDPGIMIENVFSNNPSLDHLNLSCNSGGHYQPQPLDSRRLVVSFDDGSGSGEQALPAMDVNYVPFTLHAEEATNALKVGSVPASQLLSVASGAATPLTAGNFTELLALVNGASTTYLKPSSLPSCSSGEVLKSSGGAFACVTDATGADTLAGLTCADGKILKRVSGAWVCGDESGIGSESDPTVQTFAKAAPGAGLKISSGAIAADFGSGAGKVVEGSDSRLSDSRAPTGSATGDLSGSYPNPSVKGVQGNAVSAISPSDGQVYKWVNSSSEFQPKHIGVADLKKSDGTPQMPATCAANEALSWSSITDTLTCVEIGSLDASKITSGTISAARLPAESDPTVQAFAKTAPGAGLTTSAGAIVPDFGTAAGKVAQGNDSRFPSSACASGKSRWDGSAWQCEAVSDSTKVAKAGDTMTGALSLPANGLSVGTNQLVVSGGNVGIGTTSPAIEGTTANVVALQVVPTTNYGTAGMKLGASSPNAGNGLMEIGAAGYISGDHWSWNPTFGVNIAAKYDGSSSLFYTPRTQLSRGYGALNFDYNGSAHFFGAVADTTAGATITPVERVTILSSNGNVGVGTTSPSAKLAVAGAMVSVPSNVASGATVDLSASNTITLASVGGSTITLQNMVHGGTYTLIVQDTNSRTYTFSGCNTSKFKPGNAATTAGSHTIYTIMTVYNGSTYDCYVTWGSGYL